jgi:hypothetical protein
VDEIVASLSEAECARLEVMAAKAWPDALVKAAEPDGGLFVPSWSFHRESCSPDAGSYAKE